MSGREETKFEQELRELINRHSMENGSNTPDFLLKEYIVQCLMVWDNIVRKRDEYYGIKHNSNENVIVCNFKT